MHPIDIDATLKTFSVIVDSREQKWGHIEKALKATETPYTQHKLNYGDYTCEAVKPNSEPVSLAQSVVIERKANLDEIVGNFTKGRERFDREFKRSVEDHAKVFCWSKMIDCGKISCYTITAVKCHQRHCWQRSVRGRHDITSRS